MKRLLLCVGAAKTGTTWLYRMLEHNPGLWFTPEKELNYHFTKHGWFNRLTPEIRAGKRARMPEKAAREGLSAEATAARDDWYRRFEADPVDDAWYRAMFDGMPEDRWAADFSPSTSLILETGWAEIARFAPEVKLIYILREPEERLWSHAKFHAQFTGAADRFRGMNLRQMERFVEKSDLLVDGRYGTNLARMLAHVPRDRILLIDNARISAAPMDVLREVEAFVGLPPTEVTEDRLSQPVNQSERRERPEGFGDLWRAEFRRETALLLDQGVEFAQPWAERHARLPMRRRSLLARIMRR